MDTWIISESEDVTARVRKSLHKLEVECPLTRIISADSVGRAELHSVDAGVVVFFTALNLLPNHLDFLRQLRSATDAHVVVVSSVTNHATVLKAIRAGASDFLNADGSLDEEMADLVARFTSERVQRTSKGRLITIVPCQVPSDASMLSVNVSAVIARHVGACGLLDFQLRGGDLALLLKLSPRHTIFDLLNQQVTIDEAMFQQALTPHDSGIRLLAGPDSFVDLKNVRPQVCQQIISLAQRSHQAVIINSEDVQHAEQVRALAESDEIVLAMRLDVVSLYRAQQHIEFMTRNRLPREHIHVVAIGAGYSGELPVAAVKKVLQIPSLHCIPDDPVATIRSVNVGNPLVLEFPSAKISKAIAAFADSLIEHSESAASSSPPPMGAVKAAAVIALNTLPFCR